MQDNFTNKEMIDKGWAGMQKILDQEMPTQAKGRRVLWYWLVPLFLLVGTSAGYALYHFQVQNKEAKESSKIPMAQIENNLKEEPQAVADALNASVKTSDEVVGTEIAGAYSHSEKGIDLEPTLLLSDVLTDQNGKQNTDQLHASSVAGQNANSPKETAVDAQPQNRQIVDGVISNSKVNETIHGRDLKHETIVHAGNLTEENVDFHQNIQSIDEENEPRMSSQMRDLVSTVVPPAYVASERNSKLVDQLPVLALENQIAIEERLLQNPMYAKVLVNRSKSRFTVAGLGLLRINGDVGVRGIGAGVELGYQLTPSLKLFTGLQYDYQKEGNIATLDFDDKSRSDQIAFEETFSDPNGSLYIDNDRNLATLNSSVAVNSDIKSLSKSFHYLHLPVGAEIQLSKKFAARMGVRFSHLLSAPSTIPVEIANPSLAVADAKTANKNNLLTNGFISNLDVAATIGVSYYLNPRLAMDASYEHGFMPIYDGADALSVANFAGESSTSNDFNRLFTLGLRYSFSRL